VSNSCSLRILVPSERQVALFEVNDPKGAVEQIGLAMNRLEGVLGEEDK
jgi:hypothetical protein